MALIGVVEKILGLDEPVSFPDLESFQDFDFIKQSETLLASTEELPIPSIDTYYRASSLSKMCPREEVLRYIYQVPKVQKINAKTRITFDLGNAFNDLVQNKWFGKWGWLVGNWHCVSCKWVAHAVPKPSVCVCGGFDFKYEELFRQDEIYRINGHPDGIIQKGNVKKIIELKTCNSRVYKYVTEFTGDALTQHIDQTQLYMWLFDIPHASIVYINKDDSNWVQFPKSRNKEILDRLLSKTDQVREGIRNNAPPKRVVCADANCARAKTCPVKKKCFDLN